jgi:hypothetical protein
MAALLWSNFFNGFSGINIIISFYFSLYSVLNTNVIPGFFQVFDNEVEYIPERETADRRISIAMKRRVSMKLSGNGKE